MSILYNLYKIGLLDFNQEAISVIKLSRFQQVMVIKKSILLILANWLMLYTYKNYAVYGEFECPQDDQYTGNRYFDYFLPLRLSCSMTDMFSFVSSEGYHVFRDTSCVPAILNSKRAYLTGDLSENGSRVSVAPVFSGKLFGFRIFTNAWLTILLPLFIQMFEEYKAYNKILLGQKKITKLKFAFFTFLNMLNYYLVIELGGFGGPSLARLRQSDSCTSLYKATDFPAYQTYIFSAALFLSVGNWFITCGPCSISDSRKIYSIIDTRRTRQGFISAEEQAQIAQIARSTNRLHGLSLKTALRGFFPAAGILLIVMSFGQAAYPKIPKDIQLNSFFDISIITFVSIIITIMQFMNTFVDRSCFQWGSCTLFKKSSPLPSDQENNNTPYSLPQLS